MPGDASVTSELTEDDRPLERNLVEEVAVDVRMVDGVGLDQVAAGGGDLDGGAVRGDLQRDVQRHRHEGLHLDGLALPVPAWEPLR